MFGVSGYWNISQINKYDYSSYFNLKDAEGLCRINKVWKQQDQNTISASYVEVTEEELYRDSDIILKGKVKEVFLFLQKNSSGNLVIMGGPQGRFDITSSSDSKVFIENHLTKAVRESIQEERKLLNKELNLNIPESILPDTELDTFQTDVKETIQQYASSSITGYLSPDISDISGQSTLKSGFKIEILGEDISTLSQADGSFQLSNIPVDIADFTVRM